MKNLQLFVVGIDSKTVVLGPQQNLTQGSTIKQLKQAIQKKLGVKADEQRLIHTTKNLDDENKTLAAYGIQNNSSILLVLRLQGGDTTKIDLTIKLVSGEILILKQLDRKMTVKELKCLIYQKNNLLQEDHMDLYIAQKRDHYSKKDKIMKNEKRIQECKILESQQIHQEKGGLEANQIILSDKECLIYQTKQVQRAQMPCLHAMSTQGMTQHLRSLITGKKTQIRCPQPTCQQEWEYKLCKKVGVLTLEEMKEFEIGIAKNVALKKLGVKQCLQCNSYVMKPEDSFTRVECTNCLNKGLQSEFCWHCMKRWKNSSTSQLQCGYDDCTQKIRNMTLANCPTKSILSYSDNVPIFRACPSCKTLVEHTSLCPMMQCCGWFCFICLKFGGEEGCSQEESGGCELAPRQII